MCSAVYFRFSCLIYTQSVHFGNQKRSTVIVSPNYMLSIASRKTQRLISFFFDSTICVQVPGNSRYNLNFRDPSLKV